MTCVQAAESRLEFEAELREQLSQQAAAHSDHLVSALQAQRVKLEAQFERQLIVGVQAARQRMAEEISALVNRVDAIEAAVDGQPHSAVVVPPGGGIKQCCSPSICLSVPSPWLKNRVL